MRPFFVMHQKSKKLAQGAMIAAMYVALTHMQNFLLPGSATWAIQFRLAEALCVLAFFTPAAIPGLSVGCFLFNLTYSGALPADALVGTLATLLAAVTMYSTRHLTIKNFPLIGLMLPALFNGLLVGWELTVYIGGAFWLNAFYVALGELVVLLLLGTILYITLKNKKITF